MVRRVVKHRRERNRFREGRKIHPGTAAAVLGAIRENEGSAEPIDAHEGNRDAFLLVVPEAFLDFGRLPEVERSKRFDERKIGEVVGPIDLCRDADLNWSVFARGRDRRWGGQAQFLGLLVKERREEEELLML